MIMYLCSNCPLVLEAVARSQACNISVVDQTYLKLISITLFTFNTSLNTHE